MTALKYLYKEALHDLSNKDYVTAKRKFDVLSLAQPDKYNVKLNLAICYVNLRDNDQARIILEELWPSIAHDTTHIYYGQTCMLLSTVYLQYSTPDEGELGPYDKQGVYFLERTLRTNNKKLLYAGHFINASIVYLRLEQYRRAAAILYIALKNFAGRLNQEELEGCYINLTAALDGLKYGNLVIRYSKKLLEIAPHICSAYALIALYSYRQRHYEESLYYADKGLALEPQHIGLLGSKATALRWLGRPLEADDVYQYALRHDLMNETTWANYALLCESCGRNDEALRIIQQEIHKHGETESLCFYRAQINLRLGNFKKGFKEYQHRWHDKDKKRTYGCKRPGKYWRYPDDDLRGKTLYIHYEQGFGDSLLYSRFVPMVKEITGVEKVYLETQPSMKLLLQPLANIDGIFSYDEPQPYTDYSVSLLSLPYFLDMLDDGGIIPSASGYLHAPPLITFSKPKGFNIAIAWRGNADQPVEMFRHIPVEYFVTLSSIPGVNIFNVQPDMCAQEIKDKSLQKYIHDVSPNLNNFAKTASFINQCDLVISSCTALANLAGAINKECWVACSWMGDWRWGTNDKAISQWYDSVHIIRQKSMWDWDSVFATIHQRLKVRLQHI